MYNCDFPKIFSTEWLGNGRYTVQYCTVYLQQICWSQLYQYNISISQKFPYELIFILIYIYTIHRFLQTLKWHFLYIYKLSGYCTKHKSLQNNKNTADLVVSHLSKTTQDLLKTNATQDLLKTNVIMKG